MINYYSYSTNHRSRLAPSVKYWYYTIFFLLLEVCSPAGFPAWLAWWVLHTQTRAPDRIAHVLLVGLIWDIFCSSDILGVRALSLLIQIYFLQVQRVTLMRCSTFTQLLAFLQILCLGEMTIYWGELLVTQTQPHWTVFPRILSTLLLWRYFRA